MNEFSRRRFLSRLTVALTVGMSGIVGLPILGYLLAPLFRAPTDELVAVGAITDFPIGETKLVSIRDPSPLAWAGQTADTALWVRRRETDGPQMFQVFNVNCTHLGCPVNWQAGAKLFLCPCHGGVFYSDGTVAGGPPPRPLFERGWQVSGDRLLVRQQPLPTVKQG
ncbi:MAG TPA: ubiquinol-cytochrome c reductase iron-sulfur subunit [Candidatus Bathyarchaeia archaeon]|nr:ubiquinol-cytochrome c reductase iron-sulfur subunit [Candidatus Bathyarchaeia archaeon]